jgi:hypothetical protein
MDSIHLPNAITLPTTFGAPGTALPPEQVVQALVLDLIESDVFRLQLPQAVIDVRANVALSPGSTITLAIKGSGQNARLTIYADGIPAQSVAQDPAGLAGRRPIGEAVIVARAPIGPERPIPSQPQVTAVITPERALGAAVRVAASRQSGLAPLYADIEQIAQVARAAPDSLPAPVRAAAIQIAALRLPLDQTLSGADLKQAFQRSGILFEPRLAANAAAEAGSPSSATGAPPAVDLKAALLVFRQVLKAWSAETAPLHAAPIAGSPVESIARPGLPLSDIASIKNRANAIAAVPLDALPDGLPDLLPNAPPLSPEQATSLSKSVATQLLGHDSDHPAAPGLNGGPAPPYRGAPLSAQPPAVATIAPDTPAHETAERLLTETDGAIARTTLLQAASLPDQPAQRADPALQRWTFEIPFATPQGTGVAQFEVSRDGRPTAPDAPASVWRARFSLDVEPMGPVHAMVAIAGERASVTLWAERISTVTRLNEHASLLGDALRAAELEPADFQFRVGAPPAAKQAAPGRFMDRAT